jgi:chemotaxis protein CheX
MDIAELIPGCIASTKQTLGMMAATEVSDDKISITSDRRCWGDVTGFLGLAGTNCNGNFIISFSESAVLGIVSRLLMEEFTEINDDVLDAVGEITNMISGKVKKELLDCGHKIDMVSPVVIQGRNIPIVFGGGSEIHRIEFSSDVGPLVVEICFKA